MTPGADPRIEAIATYIDGKMGRRPGPLYAWMFEEAQQILAADDAVDKAAGIVRVDTRDEATIERAGNAIVGCPPHSSADVLARAVLAGRSPEERFWSKVNKTEGCWLWTGALSEGYGNFAIGRRNYRAHRLAYEMLTGPIPSGLQLDHTCHTQDLTCPGGSMCQHRRCANPDHMEPVTSRENTRRGFQDRCRAGHPFTEANTLSDYRGHRRCRICERENQHKKYLRRKARALAGEH